MFFIKTITFIRADMPVANHIQTDQNLHFKKAEHLEVTHIKIPKTRLTQAGLSDIIKMYYYVVRQIYIQTHGQTYGQTYGQTWQQQEVEKNS